MINQINSDVSVLVVDTRLCDSEDNLDLIEEELVYRVADAAQNNVPLLFSAWGTGLPVQTFNENFTADHAITILSTTSPIRGGNLQSLKQFNDTLSPLPVNHHVKIHIYATHGFTTSIFTEQPRLAHLKFTLDPVSVEQAMLIQINEEFTVDSLADRHPRHTFPSSKRMKMTTE